MKKEDKILNSLNGLQKTKAPDFFYTHLIGKMQQQFIVEKRVSFSLRPVFSTLILCILIGINIFSLTQFSKKTSTKFFHQTNQSVTIDVFAAAYNMNAETIYE